jgi:protein involved in polysaccharide export with SLBB domain
VYLKLFLFFTFSILVKFQIFAQPSFNIDPSILRDPTGYKLRANDRVKIIVRGESDCTVEQTISADGLVSPAHLGELFIAGMNTKDAVKLIENEYITNLIFARPKINLIITKYSERVVYLTGSVNRKGPYAFPPEVEAMNIVEVIARAGGFNNIAKKNRVYVTRTFFDENGVPKNTQTYEVDVEALSSGEFNSKKSFWIYPGDRIDVPERLI